MSNSVIGTTLQAEFDKKVGRATNSGAEVGSAEPTAPPSVALDRPKPKSKSKLKAAAAPKKSDKKTSKAMASGDKSPPDSDSDSDSGSGGDAASKRKRTKKPDDDDDDSFDDQSAEDSADDSDGEDLSDSDTDTDHSSAYENSDEEPSQSRDKKRSTKKVMRRPKSASKRPRASGSRDTLTQKALKQPTAAPPAEDDDSVKISTAASHQRVNNVVETLTAAGYNPEMSADAMRTAIIAPVLSKIAEIATATAQKDEVAAFDALVYELSKDPLFSLKLDAESSGAEACGDAERQTNVVSLFRALVLVFYDRAAAATKTSCLDQSNILTAYLAPYYPYGEQRAIWSAASCTVDFLARCCLAPDQVAQMGVDRACKPPSSGLQYWELSNYFNIATQKDSEIRLRIANVPSVAFFVTLLMHLHKNTRKAVNGFRLWPRSGDKPFSDAFDKTKTKERAR